jgi:four helix bundle protein
MKLRSYKDLVVWEKSVQLVIAIYKLTKRFPKSELYGLVSQMRRAAVAIPSNIAEGYTRGHRAEYLQFLQVAYSSSAELETQLIIAQKLGYQGNFEEEFALLLEVTKMLSRMISKLRKKR